MNKQYIVIGLGRFGTSLAKTLSEQGSDVLVIDDNEEKINIAASYATQAIEMDATDELALKSIGLRNFDVACICIGEIESSIMTTLLCKEQGVEVVLAKASSERHAKVLYKMGADKVVFPELDTGVRTALSLLSTNVLDFIELSPDFGIAEFEIYDEWVNRSIIDLHFRKQYGLNIIAIRHANEKLNINIVPSDVLMQEDRIVVVGSKERIGSLESAIASKK